MSPEAISQALDAITKTIRRRMDDVGPTMINLLPTEYDWATKEEKSEIHRLKLMLPSAGQLALEARQRLAIRRAARKNT